MHPLDVDQVLYPMSYRDVVAGEGVEPSIARLMRPASSRYRHPAVHRRGLEPRTLR